ncbi:MAG: N-acetyltransferase family protein [Acidimicrobiia bacterium]
MSSPRPEPPAQPPPVGVRLATRGDAAAIREIYNHEVTHTTATFDLVPRSLEEQRAWLAARTGAFAAIVATSETADGDDEVVGFASLSPYKERAAYRTTVEDSIYIRRDQQGRGVGKLLLSHLVSVAEASGFHAVMARIEASGAASRALHASCGFELVGIEREVGRKFNRWLSVAVMQRVLGTRTPGHPG